MVENSSESGIVDYRMTSFKGIRRGGFGDKEVIDVQIGQVKAAGSKAILQSKAIGSCIGFVIYDFDNRVAVMAHIMLPGEAPSGCKESEKNKYAVNAVRNSLYLMRKLKGNIHSSAVFVVGAGNILKRKDDTICRDNLRSITQILDKYNLKITCMATGGTQRRSVLLDLEAGALYCNEGDGKRKKLWSLNKAG